MSAVNKIKFFRPGRDFCATNKMTISTAMVSANGRPSKSRCGKSETIIEASSATSHASGRLSHGHSAAFATMNSPATHRMTSPSAPQPVARWTKPSSACQPRLWSSRYELLSTRISVHGLPLTALAQCRSASSPGR